MWSGRTYYNIAIRLRFCLTENEHVYLFAESRSVVANQMAEAGSSYEHREKNWMILSQLSNYFSALEVLPVVK